MFFFILLTKHWLTVVIIYTAYKLPFRNGKWLIWPIDVCTAEISHLWCYNDAVAYSLSSFDSYHDSVVILGENHLLQGNQRCQISLNCLFLCVLGLLRYHLGGEVQPIWRYNRDKCQIKSKHAQRHHCNIINQFTAIEKT